MQIGGDERTRSQKRQSVSFGTSSTQSSQLNEEWYGQAKTSYGHERKRRRRAQTYVSSTSLSEAEVMVPMEAVSSSSSFSFSRAFQSLPGS
jgi:hypothetical protein